MSGFLIYYVLSTFGKSSSSTLWIGVTSCEINFSCAGPMVSIFLSLSLIVLPNLVMSSILLPSSSKLYFLHSFFRVVSLNIQSWPTCRPLCSHVLNAWKKYTKIVFCCYNCLDLLWEKNLGMVQIFTLYSFFVFFPNESVQKIDVASKKSSHFFLIKQKTVAAN